MKKAIVDTTVLTDILLNSGEIKSTSLAALDCFETTLLPVYAIKEFKAGPLKNFVYIHNKFVTTKSYTKTIDALQRLSRTPQRYMTSTSLQALREASSLIGKKTPDNFSKNYGKTASIDNVLCDETRLAIKFLIMSSWKKRRKIATEIICPLTCYREVAPYEKRKLIEIEPKRCSSERKCSLTELFRNRPQEVRKMRDAIADSTKPENIRRSKTLHQINRKHNFDLQDKECKSLGDAVFVLLAKTDTIVLTTNLSDHEPLAKAIGKVAISPKQVVTAKQEEKNFK